MNGKDTLQQMEHWGYYLFPNSHRGSPGYGELVVAIRAIPTRMHFDPESIRLQARDGSGLAAELTLGLKPPSQERIDVCPGRIILTDRVNKRVEFFTFGGTLEMAAAPGETVYSHHSPAPILEISNGVVDRNSAQLAATSEALLAEMRAAAGADEHRFARRLARVDPLELYLSSLRAILGDFARSAALRDTYPAFYQMLLEEKRRLAQSGQWPSARTLEELLVLN